MSENPKRVLLVRGHHPTVWGLRAYERLPERFDVRLVTTDRLRFDITGLDLTTVKLPTLRDRLPRGVLGDYASLALRDRFRGGDDVFGSTDLVHAEELSLWFSADVARLKRRHGFRLAVTVWETIPLLEAYRSPHARAWRRETLAEADLFIASTDRARHGLLLEGVPDDHIVVSYPGVDVHRFAAATAGAPHDGHVILSPGRLEWEKGHQDVLRAVALLRKGHVPLPADVARGLRVRLVGSGPEADRLRRYASELGIADAVEFRSVPYEEMPGLYAEASCMVLASLPRSGCALHPGDIPRCFWEEQFGLVLAEAMAAGLPLLVSASGAIPEVTGPEATFFTPGDWIGLAQALASGPLSESPGARRTYDAARVDRYSIERSTERIAAAYDRVLT
ncbi:glycosyltransferase [Candidatus Solirubrobacter pratensis]|uniref:glycosyltransferase n=1 Tax=Candidatus Solirubrobacter pratensis TaxID=1298857 RepID=UPI000485B6BF|nr:glycosyltransferase [Candidatus Solirubrobacter pratensis]